MPATRNKELAIVARWQRTPLSVKLIGATLMFLALATIGSTLYTISSERRILLEQIDAQGASLTRAASIFSLEPLLIRDYPVLETYAENMVEDKYDVSFVSIMRDDGRTVAQASNGRSAVPQGQVRVYEADIKVRDADHAIGKVSVGISMRRSHELVASRLWALGTGSMVTFLALALLLFLLVKKTVADPLRQLAGQARALGRGALDDVITLPSGDELGQLAGTLDRMRRDLKTSYTEIEAQNCELKELGRLRDEFFRKQLVQSEKMASIGQLAAGVAHEINNPVGFVMSNLGSLGQYIGTFKRVIGDYDAYSVAVREGDSLRQQEILGRIEEFKQQEDLSYVMEDVDELIAESTDGTKRVKEIVQGLKSFARVDESAIQEANLNECIEATLKVVWNELKYKCEIHKEFGELPQIRCYPGQLNQVFMNLLVNAAQAIPERGDIRIRTEATDTHIVINISDTGKGIPEENVARIFDPFFTTKAVGSGTGLGLSISYGIVQKHNGTMEIESQVGEGTTFTIRLPIKGVQDE